MHWLASKTFVRGGVTNSEDHTAGGNDQRQQISTSAMPPTWLRRQVG
jgi:ribosomal protein L2